MSLVELMVGLTIGLIAMVVIVQTLSVFEAHRRTTTGAVDAQENGLLALMTIEADVRAAAAGFNDPAAFSCANFFSFYQDLSGTGAGGAIAPFFPAPILIDDNVAKTAVAGVTGDTVPVDQLVVRHGVRLIGAAGTFISETIAPPINNSVQIKVDRAFDFRGEPTNASEPPADVIMISDSLNCSLMRVSSKNGNELTMSHGPSGKANEYNPPTSYMAQNNWPGFGSRAAQNYPEGALVFRLGDSTTGGMRSITYTVNANNSLLALNASSGAAPTADVVASEIVALQAQYGISSNKASKTINAWVEPTGTDWSLSALSANTQTAVDNRQRIKAIRIAVVARSSKRDGAIVTTACTSNHATNNGPCAWTDDSEQSPAPAIDLSGDPDWQHYRYKVYQTVIPMRNVLWPKL